MEILTSIVRVKLGRAAKTPSKLGFHTAVPPSGPAGCWSARAVAQPGGTPHGASALATGAAEGPDVEPSGLECDCTH